MMMEDSMNITSAQYVTNIDTQEVHQIKIVLDGQEMFVPLDPANRHFIAIQKAVANNELTIQEASE